MTSTPSETRAVAGAVLLSGAAATIAFDLFGQALSPMVGLPALSPVPLANSVIETLAGSRWSAGAEFLHYVAGLVVYPLGWLFVAAPLSRKVAPGLPWSAAAALYGVALWAFALYGMAHLIVGMPAFLGFGAMTWVALAGHVLFALVAAGVVRRLLGVSAAPGSALGAGRPVFA